MPETDNTQPGPAATTQAGTTTPRAAATTSTPAAGATAPDPVKQLLQTAKRLKGQSEALDPDDLVSSVTNFGTGKAALLAAYKDKYPDLRTLWNTQHQQIVQLHSALSSAYPEAQRNKLINDCICTRRRAIQCEEDALQKRQLCAKGVREQARDAAEQVQKDAKTRLDALTANADGISAALDNHADLITQIKALLSTPNQPIVLLLFWFELLPGHLQLMPSDAPADYQSFGKGELEADLCKAAYAQPCPTPAGVCTPPAAGAPPAPVRRRVVPWLARPGTEYESELIVAWNDYLAAVEKLVAASGDYEADRDDLTAMQNQLDADKAALDEATRTCLVASAPSVPAQSDTANSG
jgi:hypothetical protein